MKEGFHSLAQISLSFWLLLMCIFIFFMPKLNVLVPQNSLSQGPEISNQDGQLDPQPNSGEHSPPAESEKFSLVSNNGNQTSNIEAKFPFLKALKTVENTSDPCGGRYIYAQELPRRFNEAMLEDCENLVRATNMCRYLENDGFGPAFDNAQGVFSDSGWFDTNQFALDLIFHRRMERYDCLTKDSSFAAAIYVPFYAGFDASRYAYTGKGIQVRDAMSYELADWLKNTSQWRIMGGKDHFIAAGRVTWEFRRWRDNDSYYGNKFLFLPEIKNMSTLLIESSPYNSYDFAIPYPTYFHPSNDNEVLSWQDRVRKLKREWLFSFAGGPRPWDPKSIRNDVFDECRNSKFCKLFQCAHDGDICTAANVMRVFQNSHFCLQPPGDSPTRRSTFDAILAGCIPVFFHPAAAYVQYTWHLPENYSSYSVFIPEDEIRKKNVSIERTLRQISSQRIEEMKEEVINLIPRIIYGDPHSKRRTFKDAFDAALEGIIRRVTKVRRDTIHGRTHENFNERLSWKYSLLDKDDDGPPEKLGPHEWDPYFN